MEDIVHADLFQTLHALTFANSEQASFARDSPTQHEMTLPVRAPVAGPVDRCHDRYAARTYGCGEMHCSRVVADVGVALSQSYRSLPH